LDSDIQHFQLFMSHCLLRSSSMVVGNGAGMGWGGDGCFA